MSALSAFISNNYTYESMGYQVTNINGIAFGTLSDWPKCEGMTSRNIYVGK